MALSQDLLHLHRRYSGAVTFKFGDSADLSARLIRLVRVGKKTATTGALRDFEQGEPLPEPGRCDIVLNWSGDPELVIKTEEVVKCRFLDVTDDMALAEGERETREAWAADHRAYFLRNGGFSEDMMVVWERFSIVEDLRCPDRTNDGALG
ncbi:ASCH domain-containing protein [Marivita sp. S0852]|uniref:ASCH domain-containing protein n=1 Tax=Marivita sp. S0852 TaxID=3373893 RepID=UPI0039821378